MASGRAAPEGAGADTDDRGEKGPVAMFLSRFDNKVDKKGRVSVPAAWRAAMANQAFQGIVVYPSLKYGAIEGCAMNRIALISESIDSYNPFSDEYDAFTDAILTKSHQLPFDGDGRVVLPEAILVHAAITDVASFAGRGQTFQIWQPAAYDSFSVQMASKARDEAARLPLKPPAPAGAAESGG